MVTTAFLLFHPSGSLLCHSSPSLAASMARLRPAAIQHAAGQTCPDPMTHGCDSLPWAAPSMDPINPASAAPARAVHSPPSSPSLLSLVFLLRAATLVPNTQKHTIIHCLLSFHSSVAAERVKASLQPADRQQFSPYIGTESFVAQSWHQAGRRCLCSGQEQP